MDSEIQIWSFKHIWSYQGTLQQEIYEKKNKKFI